MKLVIFLLICFYTFSCAVFAQCQHERVFLQVLGSGGPELNDQRASTSYLVWLDNKAVVMIDAGGGSSYNFEKSGADFNHVNAIAFTHFHVDHSADFSEYIKYSYFSNRTNDLSVYGPEGNTIMPSASKFIHALYSKEGAYGYLNHYIETSNKSSYHINITNVSLTKARSQFHLEHDLMITAVPVHHGPLAAVAWRVDVAGCAITFSGDMSNKFNVLADLAMDSDILVAHNAVPENANRFALNLHMPPSEIGKIANEANVKKLILSHRMKRTLGKEKETLEMVQQHYAGAVEFSNDLDKFDL
ncbi:MAG: MBL fold metallo-hydrolase [Gammaproteobacteria bacterium]